MYSIYMGYATFSDKYVTDFDKAIGVSTNTAVIFFNFFYLFTEDFSKFILNALKFKQFELET